MRRRRWRQYLAARKALEVAQDAVRAAHCDESYWLRSDEEFHALLRAAVAQADARSATHDPRWRPSRKLIIEDVMR